MREALGLANSRPRARQNAGLWSRTDMWSPGRPVPLPVSRVLRSPGQPLSASAHDAVRAPGFDLTQVRVHADERAAEAAMMLGARAFTVGSHMVFGPGQYDPVGSQGRELLRHELSHVVQAGAAAPADRPVMVESPASERQASTGRARRAAVPLGGNIVQRHPAEKILKWAAKWLSKRTAKLISKHIARHARDIAGRAIHSVFKNPRRVKYLVKTTIKEAAEVAERSAAKLATEAIEEGSIRIVRQGTRTPGKYRWIVQKTFTEAIGTGGQRILRIVIDHSGRIVTAFPTDVLIGLGITVAGVEAFSERTAEAAESVHESVARQTALEAAAEQPDDSSWWDWIPIIGDIWGGNLNAGESETLAAGREAEQREKLIKQTIDAVIHDLEQDKQATLGPEQRQDVEEFVRMVLTSGMDISEDDLAP
jgi:Domain of unknown function (DUF4157)